MRQDPPTVPVLCLSNQGRAVHSGPLFDVVHPGLRLSSTSLSAFQGSLEDCLGQAVVAGHVSEPGQLVRTRTAFSS